jgi:hypothetical protein
MRRTGGCWFGRKREKAEALEGFTVASLGFLIADSGEWELGCALVDRARELNPLHPILIVNQQSKIGTGHGGRCALAIFLDSVYDICRNYEDRSHRNGRYSIDQV